MTRRCAFRIALAVAVGSITLAAGFNAAAGVIAAEPQPQSEPGTIADSQSPSELAREGAAKMLEAFDRFVDSVPRYELPQLNENGDIILRRKRPESVPAMPPTKTPEPAAGRAI